MIYMPHNYPHKTRKHSPTILRKTARLALQTRRIPSPPHPLTSRTLPRNRQSLRHRSRRNSRLHRPRRDTARVPRRAARIRELGASGGGRKHRGRGHGGGADEVRILDGAGAFAGGEGEAGGAGSRGREGGACAADVPGAGADDAAVRFAARGDLEGSLAGERGSGGGGGGAARGGGRGGGGSGGAGAGFGEVFDACCWAV